jgi:hypothetical protein
VGQHDLGLRRDQVLEGLVAGEPAAGGDDAGGEQVLQGPGTRHGGADQVHRVADLGLGQDGEQGVAPAREGPVDGGSGQAGGLGHVVEGGLGDAPTGDAGERRVEDPVLGRAGVEQLHR